MNDLEDAVLAQNVLTFLAKRSIDRGSALQVAAMILNAQGIESLKNTKTFKALEEKADLT